jgi:hypothetical protein
VGTVIKEAADLWSQHLLRLLPVSAFAYAMGFAVWWGVSSGVERLPFITARAALNDDASVLEGLAGVATLLAGPVAGFLLGGAVVSLFWAACCRIALDQVTVSAALRAVSHDLRVAVRFVVLGFVTLLFALIPFALATALSGMAGRIALGVGLVLMVNIWPFWMMLVPLSLRDKGPFLRRFQQLVSKEARRALWYLGGLVLLISVLMSVPAMLAVTMDARLLLVGCVLVPFHAALAPMQAFIQARAYAQLA